MSEGHADIHSLMKTPNHRLSKHFAQMLYRAIGQKETLALIVGDCSTHVAVINNTARQKDELRC